MEKSLYDTGFLFATLDEDDDYHSACFEIYQTERNVLLPDVVLPELAFLIKRELKLEDLTKFLRAVAKGGFEIVHTTGSDLERAAEILEKYDDNKIDLVDACVFAMAERLKIEKILTVDRRHFTVFRPKHCETFEILP